MESVFLYVYQSPVQAPLLALLEELHPDSVISHVEKNVILIKGHVNDEPLDYEEIIALLKSDFTEDITMIFLHEETHHLIPIETIVSHIRKLKPAYYDMAHFLKSYIIDAKINAETLKRRFLSVLGQDLLDTALSLAKANMNVSNAAKYAHMHRNTFMYRMEIIHRKTALNISKFADLSIIVMLFD